MKPTPSVRPRWPLLLFALACCALSTACVGPDPMRMRAERADLALAHRCADGWFGALPHTPDDERLTRQALVDWGKRLAADERAAAPAGGR